MCFVHHGVDCIKEIVQKNLVNRLNIKSGPKLPRKCKPCILGNQKQRPFDMIVIPVSNVLELVAVDISGSARVQSIGSAQYAMGFMDNASSQHGVFFLKNRRAKTTLSALKSYTTIAEQQTSQKLKRICCNNEFDCKLWHNWAAARGVLIEPMAPYSSAANDMAERSFGIVFGSVHIMLLEAGLSMGWWAEACDFAIKVGNLLPMSRYPEKIPEEV